MMLNVGGVLTGTEIVISIAVTCFFMESEPDRDLSVDFAILGWKTRVI